MKRVRWAAWLNVVLWGALGGVVTYYRVTLEPIFASFGGDLPLSTRVFLFIGPLYSFVFAAALLGGLRLLFTAAPETVDPLQRKRLWLGVGGALLAALLTLHALFAPMFMGSLAGS